MAHAGKVLQGLGCLHLDLCRLLVSDLSAQDTEQVGHCGGLVDDEGRPARGDVRCDRVVEGLVEQNGSEIE